VSTRSAFELKSMYPINRRFCELCMALQIVAHDEGSKEFYERLRGRVLELIDNYFELTDGVLRVERFRNQGPAWSLNNELTAKGAKTGLLTKDTAELAVYRLLGFVHSPTGWVQLPRVVRGEPQDGARARHRAGFAAVPHRVRERILELWESAPHLLRNYAEDAIGYLRRERADPLPEPPWSLPYEFDDGHDLILEFLSRAKDAKAAVTVAAVNSYITASIGRQIFLRLLLRGVGVRFLLFDFIHGDAEHVARMVRRSADTICVFGHDTIEALLRLREEARAAGKLANLDVRLLDHDLEGRWYLVDPLEGGCGFVVPRASNRPDSGVAGGRVIDQNDLARHVEQVNRACSRAQKLDDWLPAYDAWKSSRVNQAAIGLR
jgi:hypothetical protein